MTFVTGNSDKLREAAEILGIELRQSTIELPELQAIDVEALIIQKAEDAYKRLHAPVIVEDTGLSVLAWNGLPGALIKWFQKTVDNNGMLRMLAAEKDRRALAQCFVALHDGAAISVFKGEISGTISDTIRGDQGFGWDRIFIPDGESRTFGEMAASEKNAISHRKLAFENLRKHIEKARDPQIR